MLLLVSGATATIREHLGSPHLGHLLTPAVGNSLRATLATGLPWAADNAAFSGFDAAAFCAMLGRVAKKERCLFVACPDVVGNARATLTLFEVWQPVIAALELPVALVGQDGLEALDVPWPRMRAMFLGGSTEWKLSQAAAGLVAEAKRRGLWTHMGRCNTRRRMEHAFALGCDSVDGSGFSRWPGQRIPKGLKWLRTLHGLPTRKTAERNGETPGRVPLARRFGEKLLGSPGWLVEGASLGRDGYHVRARYAPEADRCPRCGADRWAAGTVHRHGSKRLRLRDLPWEGKAVTLDVRRRRYRCRDCAVTFLQPLPILEPSRGMTRRLADHVGEEALRRGTSAVAARFDLGKKRVRRLARAIEQPAAHPHVALPICFSE